jgi:uncharacterized RDD family membrane protein YckC
MAMVMSVTTSAQLAGFWPRVWALAIDVAAVNVVLALLALALFEPTGGFIRISELPLVKQSVCRSFTSEHPRDAGFERTTTTMCERSLLGRVHDRRVEVSEERKTGAVTTTRAVAYAVDADGQPMRAIYLDEILLFVLMVYLAVAEWWFGTTFGKRLVGLRVEIRDGQPLRFASACKRLLRFAPAVPLAAAAIVMTAVGPAAAHSTALWVGGLALYVVAAALCLAFVANFAKAVPDKDLPWHDRWAGTRVVRR